MPYTLNAGRVIVGPSGLKLAYLERNIPGAAGEDAISPTEADRLARQIVEALNLMEAARNPDAPAVDDPRHRVEVIGRDGTGEHVLAWWPVPMATLAICLNAAHEKRDQLAATYPGALTVREINSPAVYCVGWNSPGYMPEGEPEGGYQSWSEAVEALAALIEADAEERLDSAEEEHEGDARGEAQAAIRAAKAGALDALKMAPTDKEERQGLDVVFMGRAYFIRPDEPEAEEGPDRDGWSIGDRAGAFEEFGDRGEIVDFKGEDSDGYAIATVQLDYCMPGDYAFISVQKLDILTDD